MNVYVPWSNAGGSPNTAICSATTFRAISA